MAKSMEVLQTVAVDPQVVAFVAGAFERLGVHVRDTGEVFGEGLRFSRWYRQWRKGVSRRGSDHSQAQG